ncbi:MAG: hypothetical protein S4CHLAM81_00130 [Chlamydiales bacterium]|nr:hypothetical protein [Chlamydiales bacterium]MCH9634815.1 hypothetical protein [Chlamydiales bacterium]MCH9703517.1 hypothetical protein [Chlamydiota bacterium]
MRVLALITLLLCSSYRSGLERWVLTIHAEETEISESTLTLKTDSSLVAAFTADGGRRTAGMPLAMLLHNWSEIFDEASPKALLVFSGQGDQFQEHLLILKPPTFGDGTISFSIVELDEVLVGSLGESVLMIHAELPFSAGGKTILEAELKTFDS